MLPPPPVCWCLFPQGVKGERAQRSTQTPCRGKFLLGATSRGIVMAKDKGGRAHVPAIRKAKHFADCPFGVLWYPRPTSFQTVAPILASSEPRAWRSIGHSSGYPETSIAIVRQLSLPAPTTCFETFPLPWSPGPDPPVGDHGSGGARWMMSSARAGGVHPKVAQELLRHSTIALTMDIYTHTPRGSLSAALDVSPSLPALDTERAKATGTDDATADSGVGNGGAPVGATGPKSVQNGARGSAEAGHSERCATADGFADCQDSRGVTSQPPSGLEPETCGLQNRCSAN